MPRADRFMATTTHENKSTAPTQYQIHTCSSQRAPEKNCSLTQYTHLYRPQPYNPIRQVRPTSFSHGRSRTDSVPKKLVHLRADNIEKQLTTPVYHDALACTCNSRARARTHQRGMCQDMRCTQEATETPQHQNLNMSTALGNLLSYCRVGRTQVGVAVHTLNNTGTHLL